jgi:GxxExxY protein
MKDDLNRVTNEIIGAAIQVRRALGPGLLESAYEACLADELTRRGLQAEQQKPVPLVYREIKVECGYRLDLLVEGTVIVEIKAVEALAPIHRAQLLSYLRLSGCKVGLLMNFNVRNLMEEGFERLIREPSVPSL